MTSPPTYVGASHPRIKQYVNTKQHRAGTPPRAAAIEGLWSLRAALDANADVEVVFVAPGLIRGTATNDAVAEAQRRGAWAYEVSERTIQRLTDRDGPDGVAAIVHIPHATFDDLAPTPTTRIVVLYRIELAGNLGSIIRCADGAGVSAVILSDRRTRITHPVVIKASMGTLFSMPIVDAGAAEAIAWLRDHRVRIVAADPSATTSYRDASYVGPVAIVLGSERYGLAPTWRDAADLLVSIPMHGTAVHSLNIGHAAALILYERLRAT